MSIKKVIIVCLHVLSFWKFLEVAKALILWGWPRKLGWNQPKKGAKSLYTSKTKVLDRSFFLNTQGFWACPAYTYIINYAAFSHCQTVQLTIRLLLYCQTNNLIWNWKALKRLRIQQFWMKALFRTTKRLKISVTF